MTYTVVVKRSAEKQIRRLTPSIQKLVALRLRDLEDDPRPEGRHRTLSPPLEGFRLRVGDWRILYTVDDERREVHVYTVSHRREAYR